MLTDGCNLNGYKRLAGKDAGLFAAASVFLIWTVLSNTGSRDNMCSTAQ